MKLRLPHAPYIGNKIALDLSTCGFVSLLHGIEGISKIAQNFIEADIKEEIINRYIFNSFLLWH